MPSRLYRESLVAQNNVCMGCLRNALKHYDAKEGDPLFFNCEEEHVVSVRCNLCIDRNDTCEPVIEWK